MSKETKLNELKRRMRALMLDIIADDFEEAIYRLMSDVRTFIGEYPEYDTEEIRTYFKLI